MKDKEIMYTQTEVLKLGFTKKLIETLLPDPILKPNPYYKSAAPVKLFSVDLVHEVMASETFKNYKEASKSRRQGAKKAVATKKKKLEQTVQEKIKCIHVKRVENIEKLSMNEQLIRVFERGDFDIGLSKIDDETKARWAVNYVRHKLTNYDEELYSIKGKVGIRSAYVTYKKAVLRKIAQVYPELQIACQKQIDRIDKDVKNYQRIDITKLF